MGAGCSRELPEPHVDGTHNTENSVAEVDSPPAQRLRCGTDADLEEENTSHSVVSTDISTNQESGFRNTGPQPPLQAGDICPKIILPYINPFTPKIPETTSKDHLNDEKKVVIAPSLSCSALEQQDRGSKSDSTKSDGYREHTPSIGSKHSLYSTSESRRSNTTPVMGRASPRRGSEAGEDSMTEKGKTLIGTPPTGVSAKSFVNQALKRDPNDNDAMLLHSATSVDLDDINSRNLIRLGRQSQFRSKSTVNPSSGIGHLMELQSDNPLTDSGFMIPDAPVPPLNFSSITFAVGANSDSKSQNLHESRRSCPLPSELLNHQQQQLQPDAGKKQPDGEKETLNKTAELASYEIEITNSQLTNMLSPSDRRQLNSCNQSRASSHSSNRRHEKDSDSALVSNVISLEKLNIKEIAVNDGNAFISLIFFPGTWDDFSVIQLRKFAAEHHKIASMNCLCTFVSSDDPTKLQRLIRKERPPFHILYDEDNKLAKKFHVAYKKRFVLYSRGKTRRRGRRKRKQEGTEKSTEKGDDDTPKEVSSKTAFVPLPCAYLIRATDNLIMWSFVVAERGSVSRPLPDALIAAISQCSHDYARLEGTAASTSSSI